MKTASIVGILLIVLGVIALGYQGISYTTQKKIVDVGPIQKPPKTEHKTITDLPPIVGGIALVGEISRCSSPAERIRRRSFAVAPRVLLWRLAWLQHAWQCGIHKSKRQFQKFFWRTCKTAKEQAGELYR